jgi:DnaK suppressor protein
MMSNAEVAKFRRRLQGLAVGLSGGVSAREGELSHGLGGEADGGLSDVPTHLADLGSVNADAHAAIGLLCIQQGLLAECNDALTRLEAGTFGRCEACHAEIGKQRLQFAPFARFCAACAREREAESARGKR